jgi:HAD superfamily hydrolase (TIGR01450 family)
MTTENAGFLAWLQARHDDYSAVLFDIDGTLFAGNRTLPGAVETIAWLRRQHFPFCLLTNDGNHSPEEKSAMMRRAGLDIAPDEIVSCGMAINSFVTGHSLQNALFFVMGDLGDPCYAERAGLMVTRDTSRLAECAGVIVGEGRYDWQENISAVINALAANPRRPLLVPNPDSHWPNGPNGEIGIGAGGKARFIRMILSDMGVGIEPVFLGKPHQAIYDHALTLLKQKFGLPNKLDHRRIIMLGDSLRSDIRGGNHAGLTSALVLTGITSPGQTSGTTPETTPDIIFQRL